MLAVGEHASREIRPTISIILQKFGWAQSPHASVQQQQEVGKIMESAIALSMTLQEHSKY